MDTQAHTVFLTGTGRSGTNILKKVLGSHSKAASLPFEYRFIIDPDGIVDFYNSYPVVWSPYRADKQIKRLESFLLGLASLDLDKESRAAKALSADPQGLELTPPPYSGWELEKWIPGFTEASKHLINDLSQFGYSAVWPGSKEGVNRNEMYFQTPKTKEELKPIISAYLNFCLNAIVNAQNKEVFIEDNTHNLLFANDLLELVDNSKMIHVIRDPRDVVSSLIQQRWAPKELEIAIEWYGALMDHWLEIRKHTPSDRLLEIRFEDLIHQREETLSDVCSFIGIEIEQPLREIDMSNHHIGRHESDLSLEQINLMNNRLARIIETYNY
ncbi:MAG: hypothetical protein GWP27_07460 [Bacteroidetes bacterium]|nr:hypothetical protein [Bacteroidota bacterium]